MGFNGSPPGKRAATLTATIVSLLMGSVAAQFDGVIKDMGSSNATTAPLAAAPKESDSGTVVAGVFAIILLLGFAALFAGLTLAIMGLDTLSLEIIAGSGSEPDRTYARRILPLRQKGNQLLCTLILGNVIVITLIAQVTSSLVGGWIASLISTALITVGGEIIPQATMSAHALWVGSKSAPVVNVFLLLFYVVCKPLSLFLDYAIGTDPGQIYGRSELKKLMFMHASHTQESGLGAGDYDLMMGAMELHEKTVVDVMTAVHELFMLDASEILTEEVIHEVWQSGHSRIPVYKGSKNNIAGVLFAKDLLMANSEDNTRVLDLVQFYQRRCHIVPSETKLISMLKLFQTGRSHIALVQEVQMAVHGDPFYQVMGIVTIEDVIEELVHGDILDEFDVTAAVAARDGSPGSAFRSSSSPTGSLLLSSRKARRVKMTPNQVKACALFLRDTVPQFASLPLDVIKSSIELEAPIISVRPPKHARSVDRESESNVWLYRAGTPADAFTLLISGRVEVATSNEDLVLELHSWSVLGSEALTAPTFTPHFSARVVAESLVLQLTHETFLSMQRRTATEACEAAPATDVQHPRAT